MSILCLKPGTYSAIRSPLTITTIWISTALTAHATVSPLSTRLQYAQQACKFTTLNLPLLAFPLARRRPDTEIRGRQRESSQTTVLETLHVYKSMIWKIRKKLIDLPLIEMEGEKQLKKTAKYGPRKSTALNIYARLNCDSSTEVGL